MSIRLFSVVFAIFILFSQSIFAENEKKEKKGSYLNISATEYKEVDEDVLIANLRFEYEGENPKEVQNKINQTMAKALEQAKKVAGVLISTDQYSVYKYDSNDSKGEKTKIIWRGNQGLTLNSKSAEDVLKLSGQLQDMGLLMNGLSYTVSLEKIEETRDSLMEVVIDKLMKKAKRAAKFIGKADIEVMEINIDSNNISPYQPQPRLMMMAQDNLSNEKMSEPVALPKQRQITMTISASFLLKD